MGVHATREDEVDQLLRAEKLVDLYAVVRQGLRISQPSYSIKKVEAFYMPQRETSVTDGGDSIIEFERFLDSGDRALLEAIERYKTDTPFRPPPEPWQPDAEAAAELDAVRGALLSGVPEDSAEASEDE